MVVFLERTSRTAARPDARPDRYTIRYRWCKRTGRVALIVEDNRGDLYLFSGGSFQARWAGRESRERFERVAARERDWIAVPGVAPYSIAELRRLTGAGG